MFRLCLKKTGTLMGQSRVRFKAAQGVVYIPLGTTLNVNNVSSQQSFPNEYKSVLQRKSYAAWIKMNNNPAFVAAVQQSAVSSEEFARMGES